MRLIGLGHKARQGKDTLARLIVMEAGRNSMYAKQYAFSSALYSLARRLGMKAKDPHILQALGTDVMRRIDKYIWIDELEYQLKNEEPEIAIITDVRFSNEAEFVTDHDASQLIKVV